MSQNLEQQLTDYLVKDQARFYRLAYSYLKSREEALDAVQTAVCRALEKQRELKDPEALRAWFYHILVHVCMDALRKRKRVTLIPPEALDAGSYEDPLPSDGTLAQRVDALPSRGGDHHQAAVLRGHDPQGDQPGHQLQPEHGKDQTLRGIEKTAGIFGK